MKTELKALGQIAWYLTKIIAFIIACQWAIIGLWAVIG